MIVPLTGKTKRKSPGQLWVSRYNKFRKKLRPKIKKTKCKKFWACVPPTLEDPGPAHSVARGSRKTRKNRKK
jgi:hypothetical protein